jgi:hypothetical protein
MLGRCYRQRSSRACEFPFALDEGGHSKGSAKIVMLRGRTDALRWRLNRTEYFNFAVRICRDPLVNYPHYPQYEGDLPNKDRPEAVRSLGEGRPVLAG